MLEGNPLIVSFGGGVNSAAMLVGMAERGIKPEYILFSDTGGEKPETYSFLEIMKGWCVKNIGISIDVVSHPRGDTLRDSCFRNGTLPSKAYGFPGCSVKFKHQFMESFENKVYGKDKIIIKAIGYHYEEARRSDITEKGRYLYRYFLREWGWGQDDCISALKRSGLPVPIKSACYFCPSSKKHEIIWLSKEHPDLFADSVAMEHNARTYHQNGGNVTKGLGRKWSWEELVSNSALQSSMFESDPIPCMCYDGGDDIEE